ncbi:MAG: hypothetical protein DRJ49_03110 [Thermoprotei archaeon]|nr:MAG: hypothetical protein DRN53_04220 [Thermoprotei archaeon]RLE89424.1 MAG: hypothetical protein DRJ49_03110 [Thermoprotei archaeon]
MYGIRRTILVLSMLFIVLWATLMLTLVVIEEVVLTYIGMSLLRSIIGLSLAGLWLYSCYKFSKWIFHRFLRTTRSPHE